MTVASSTPFIPGMMTSENTKSKANSSPARIAKMARICASGKYPPAEPGALGIGPLKAAGLDPKLHLCGPRRKHFLEIPTRYPIFSATVGEQIPLDILRPHLARF